MGELPRTAIALTPAQARRRKVIRDRHLYYLLAPLLAYYLIFHFVPMYGVLISFKDYNIFAGLRGSEWVGLENFRVMFFATPWC